MLDTPNCKVNPTALSARIAEVTRPKPIARVNWFMTGRLSHAKGRVPARPGRRPGRERRHSGGHHDLVVSGSCLSVSSFRPSRVAQLFRAEPGMSVTGFIALVAGS